MRIYQNTTCLLQPLCLPICSLTQVIGIISDVHIELQSWNDVISSHAIDNQVGVAAILPVSRYLEVEPVEPKTTFMRMIMKG